MAELVDAAEAVEEVARMTFSSRDFGLGLAIGVAAGGAVVYLYVEKKLRLKMDMIMNAEIDEMRDHYRRKAIAAQEKPELEGAEKIVQEEGYVPPPIPPKEEVARSVEATSTRTKVAPEKLNVFEQHADTEVQEWDYESETKFRSPERPYVIHVDELEDHPEIECVSWTYYEGDEVLVDAQEQVVTDVDNTVGLTNLDRFGHGSGDDNTVYVRNAKLGLEFEITRSEGKYEEEVLGLQHADESARRRRKFDDE